MEIGDLSEKESKEYLIKRCTIEKREGSKVIKECKIKDEQVNELYKLVGGRIVDLKVSVKKFLKGNSLEGKFGFIIFASNEFIQFCLILNFIFLAEIKQQILNEVEKKFESAQIHEDQELYEIGKYVINALLNSKELSYLKYRRVFKSVEKVKELDSNELLKKNAFVYHPENNTVTFQSQSVKSYIQENPKYILK